MVLEVESKENTDANRYNVMMMMSLRKQARKMVGVGEGCKKRGERKGR